MANYMQIVCVMCGVVINIMAELQRANLQADGEKANGRIERVVKKKNKKKTKQTNKNNLHRSRFDSAVLTACAHLQRTQKQPSLTRIISFTAHTLSRVFLFSHPFCP